EPRVVETHCAGARQYIDAPVRPGRGSQGGVSLRLKDRIDDAREFVALEPSRKISPYRVLRELGKVRLGILFREIVSDRRGRLSKSDAWIWFALRESADAFLCVIPSHAVDRLARSE